MIGKSPLETGRGSPQIYRRHIRAAVITLLLGVGLFGCSSVERPDGAPSGRVDLSSIPDAVPRVEPRSRYGNPSSYVVRGKRYTVMTSSQGHVERGIASWYGTKFHGRRTSSGEPYDMYAMTAAHKHLPLPTYVRVTNLRNGRSAVVKVNDRGPFHENRIIDLSYAAATKLGILGEGTGLVEVRALHSGQATPPAQAQHGTGGTHSATPRIFIQVGAFSNRGNADRLRARLNRNLQQRIRIQEAAGARGTIYRVQVGPLPDVAQADDVSLQLARIGLGDSHIVIE